MKKYTNKILLIALGILVLFDIIFFLAFVA